MPFILSKFSGTCRKCQKPYSVAEYVFYHGKDKGCWHSECYHDFKDKENSHDSAMQMETARVKMEISKDKEKIGMRQRIKSLEAENLILKDDNLVLTKRIENLQKLIREKSLA